MYKSLQKHCADFHLYIFTFDDTSHRILSQLNLESVTLISLEEFEDERLLAIKSSRTRGEYCWTCTPSTIVYCLSKFNLEHCTYLDADLFFFSNPKVLIDEMGGRSVLITEHRYTKEYDKSLANGIYCVQFITFKNDDDGMRVLIWWRDRCIEWCYARTEDGKFGDQKYLDDWTERFKGVHVLKHLGGGIAPWNVQQYNIEKVNHHYTVADPRQPGTVDLVFYHFHWVHFVGNQKVDLGFYKLDFPHVRQIYEDYLWNLLEIDRELDKKFLFRLPTGSQKLPEKILSFFYHDIKRRMQGTYNVIDLKSE